MSPEEKAELLRRSSARSGSVSDYIRSNLALDLGRSPESASVAKSVAADAALRGPQLFDEACERLGLSGALPKDGGLLWRDMREESIDGRLAERGMV